MRSALHWLPWLLCAACAAPSGDLFAPAEREVGRGNFLQALVLLDQVQPSHTHYAEARTLAQALERRMRVSQELLVRGLKLRSEWRDEEAVACFHRALIVWPDVSGARELITATRNRVTALSAGAREQTLPQVLTMAREQSTQEPARPEGEQTPPRALRLEDVGDLMARGDLESALDLLEVLHAQRPEDPEIKARLAEVLQQRALLRYGQAFLEAAVTDWNRVVTLSPANAQAREFLAAARAELEDRKRR